MQSKKQSKILPTGPSEDSEVKTMKVSICLECSHVILDESDDIHYCELCKNFMMSDDEISDE